MLVTIFFTVLCAIPAFSITGGEIAKLGEFPYQVQLYNKGAFFCAGSILSPFTVATAAHCFWHDGELVDVGEISVVAGAMKKIDYFNTNRIPKGIQIRKVLSYLEHPEYNNTNLTNDLAILQVDKAFNFTQTVGRIHIPKSNENFDNSLATVVGHGGSNISMTSTHLLKFHLPYGNNSNCDVVLEADNKEEVSKAHCILVERGIGSCTGDSGGPLICYRNNDNGSIPVLCGIISYGQASNNLTEDLKCGKMDMEIFTRVQSFFQWITWSVSTTEARLRCDREHFYCFSTQKCIERSKLCDKVIDCEGEEDELECQNYKACKGLEFRCSNGNCLEESDICDSTFDCGGVFYNGTLLSTSDEEKCVKLETETCKIDEHDCGLNDRCIKIDLKCDGVKDCKDLSDENDCGDEKTSRISRSSIFEEISGNLLLWMKMTVVMLILNFGIELFLFIKSSVIFLKQGFTDPNVVSLKGNPTLEDEGL